MNANEHDVGRGLVAGLRSVDGVHEGFRVAHARGSCCTGRFKATEYVTRLTRAAHMAGKPVDVTVRFSNGTGNPTFPDAAPGARGMAVKFHLPGGASTDLIAMSAPTFPARTAADVLALTAALSSALERGKDDSKKALLQFKDAFSRQRPDLADALALALFAPPPVSYAQVRYWAVHAFRFENATGRACFVRYSWEPMAGIASLSEAEAGRRSRNPKRRTYLQSELAERLKATGPIQFRLLLQLAADGDDVNDPATAWPDDRPVVFAGLLTITDLVTDRRACEALSFNPTRLTDGIACSGDPILLARPEAYARSQRSRAAYHAARSVPPG
jgi:catalase